MADKKIVEILMVDDDEGDTFMVQEALADSSCANNFQVVHDGEEALEFMGKQGRFSDAATPDIVLLDINMPRMNGHEVLSWMRDQEAYKLTPVIILTTSSSDIDIRESYEKQANCFITKPVDLKKYDGVIKVIDQFWTEIVKLPPKQ
ncbi:MAG: response regulator [Micavibrio sp.]|nr:response regulator [Micavibrio sp.]